MGECGMSEASRVYPPGGCRVRPPVYAGPAGGPARPLPPPSPAALAALRRPTFVVGCSRHDREGRPVSVAYLKQQLGANEKILYTERHHWIFFVAEMVKWIIFAAAVLALIILLKVWLSPDAGWVWWLLLVFLVPAVRIAWGFLSWRMNIYVLTNRASSSSPGCSGNAWPTRRSRSSPTWCSSSRSSGACSTTATSRCSRQPPAPGSTTCGRSASPCSSKPRWSTPRKSSSTRWARAADPAGPAAGPRRARDPGAPDPAFASR